MDYQAAHERLEIHQLTVVSLLITAFVLAFVLMFLHPPASLAVFALALAGLFVALFVGAGLRRVERAAARDSLAHASCPKCGEKVEHPADRPEAWHCDACGSEFSARGIEIA